MPEFWSDEADSHKAVEIANQLFAEFYERRNYKGYSSVVLLAVTLSTYLGNLLDELLSIYMCQMDNRNLAAEIWRINFAKIYAGIIQSGQVAFVFELKTRP